MTQAGANRKVGPCRGTTVVVVAPGFPEIWVKFLGELKRRFKLAEVAETG